MPAVHPRLRSLISLVLGLVLFVVAVLVLYRWLRHVSLEQLAAEMAEISGLRIATAIFYTFLSFLALVGYEYYGARYVGREMPLWRLSVYSFVAQAVTHAVGFATLVGTSVRYKLYAAHGWSLIETATLQAFFGSTFALGTMTLVGAVLVLEPDLLALATTVSAGVWQISGVVLLAVVASVLLWGLLFHRPLRLWGTVVTLPTVRVTFIQILLGVADLSAVAAALYVLMPPELHLGYLQVLAIFAAGITIGIISHVPGGLGVLESAIILLVAPGEEHAAALIGALVMFRAIYYMLPLFLGLVLFGWIEAGRWLQARRGAATVDRRAGSGARP